MTLETQAVLDRPAPSPVREAAPVAVDLAARRTAVLVDSLRGLDDAGIRYVITHGHAALPVEIGSDVDAIVDASASRDVIRRALLRHSGMRIVQWLSDGADYIVVADTDQREPAMVALHFSKHYDLDGHRVFRGPQLLDARVRRGPLWVTPPSLEAACIVSNRAMKRDFREKDVARLATLFATDRDGCMTTIKDIVGEPHANAIAQAVAANDPKPLAPHLDAIAGAIRSHAGDPLGTLGRRAMDAARRAVRWARPRNGFHVVFLGPDGVGKSTVIEQVQSAVRPAFLHYSYQTFAPSLLPMKYQKKDGPHSKPPRSLGASLMKAAWWTFCYGPLYLYVVHPIRARAGLVVNHRYLLDAIVDRKRYRYSGPGWLLKAIWTISPKPDLVVLLEAPADVIQKRKQEQAPEETARQCVAYRKLIDTLGNAVRVDASRSLDETVANANEAILSRMEARFAPHAQ